MYLCWPGFPKKINYVLSWNSYGVRAKCFGWRESGLRIVRSGLLRINWTLVWRLRSCCGSATWALQFCTQYDSLRSAETHCKLEFGLRHLYMSKVNGYRGNHKRVYRINLGAWIESADQAQTSGLSDIGQRCFLCPQRSNRCVRRV